MNYNYSFPIPSSSSSFINSTNLLKYFKEQKQSYYFLNILNLQQQINKQKIIFNLINQNNNNNNFNQQKLLLLFLLNQQQQKLNNEQKVFGRLTLQQQLLLKNSINNNYLLPFLNLPSTSLQGLKSSISSPSNISPIKLEINNNNNFEKKHKINYEEINKNNKNLFTIDKLLLKNKIIKKEEENEILEFIPKKLKNDNKVDYFTEEKQLSLIDGRRVGGGKIKIKKIKNEKKKKNEENIKYSLPNILPSSKKSPAPSLPSLLLIKTIKEEEDSSSLSKHICLECGKSYATSSNLSRHKQTHRPMNSPFAKKCSFCEKTYVSMPAYSMHILTHQAKHKCPICFKLFSRPWLLKGHLRSHTGQKPFGCGKCGKAFSDRSNLRAHLNTHNVEKRWQCEQCGRSFLLKSYLNKHLEQKHNIEEENLKHLSSTTTTTTTITQIMTLPSLCENE